MPGTTPNRNYPRPTLTDPADIEVVGQAIDAIDVDMPGYLVQFGEESFSGQGVEVVTRSMTFPVAFRAGSTPQLVGTFSDSWWNVSAAGVTPTGASIAGRSLSGPRNVAASYRWVAVGLRA